MGGIGMTKRMGRKLLLGVYLGTTFLDHPLDGSCGKGLCSTVVCDLTVENVFYGIFGLKICSQAPNKVRAKGKIAIDFSLALFDQNRFSMKIHIGS